MLSSQRAVSQCFSSSNAIRKKYPQVLCLRYFSAVASNSGELYENEDYYLKQGWKMRRLSDDLLRLSQQGRNDFFNANMDSPKLLVLPPQQHADEEPVEIEIPLQTKETAELLFDCIAPYLTYRQINRLKAILHKHDNQERPDRSGSSLIYKLNGTFKEDASWIRPLLLNFLVGKKLLSLMYCSKKKVITRPTTTTAHIPTIMEEDYSIADEIWLDPSFPPNANRQNWDRDLDILMRAQEKSSKCPPFWCSLSLSSEEEAMKQSQHTAHVIHQIKTKAKKQEEAEEIATLLANRLPRSRHEKLMTLLAKWAPPPLQASDGTSSNGGAQAIGTRMKFLESKLNYTLELHVHLVALDLANYLYVYVPPSNASPSNSTVVENKVELLSDEKDTSNNDLGNNRLLKAWKEWNKLRSSVVQGFLDCQLAYTRHATSPTTSSAETNRTRLDLCHDIIPKLTLLRAAVGVPNTITSGLTDYVNMKGRLRSFQRSHCVFDALILQKGLIERVKEFYQSYEKSLVFVKNLPIDITEDELQAIYGRCGPIESIQIYNKRPDLDPGKPSLKEIQKRRQRNRRMFKREESNTPVYARILFRDEEGYNVATNDNLTIFGVVIRKYPCRTVLKNKMRSLFLENFAPGQFSMDIEYKISKFLHPDLYVCLNVGYHDFTGIASCEIKFPSHEVASFAYDRLQQMEGLGADIHWIRTPSDAHMHWTREISYEYS